MIGRDFCILCTLALHSVFAAYVLHQMMLIVVHNFAIVFWTTNPVLD